MPQYRETPAAAGLVPPELQDKYAAPWMDADSCATWCRRQGIPEIRESPELTRFHRFAHGRDQWARANGMAHEIADPARLAELGIPFLGAVDRARARAESRA